MPQLQITELDFTQIKTNLQKFLANQTEFQDYNFAGSGLSVLLDVLSYNTHYNALLAHLVANEMFIDTAIKRSSVVSIAKTLGYIPRTSIASRAILTIVVTPPAYFEESTLTMDAGTAFTATVNGVTYTFTTQQAITTTKVNDVFTYSNIEVLEGQKINTSFTVASDTLSGPFILQNNNLDSTTLLVEVKNTASDVTSTTYTNATSLVGLDGASKVYWLEENPFGQYQIIFGDNTVGEQLTTGNVVLVQYTVCSGSAANGASTFSPSSTIGGLTNIAITTVSQSSAGSDTETIDSVRYNAPRFNATRNRAVTSQDYQSLILANFPKAKSVSIWGGENNVPPIYGKVFITIDPQNGQLITESDKDYILNTIIQPRAVMSIQHEFVDPDYLYLGFDFKVKYDTRLTTQTASYISSAIQSEIQSYFNVNLKTLNKTFFYTQLIDDINNLFPQSLVSILSIMTVQKRIIPPISSPYSGYVQFLTTLKSGTLKSTLFSSTVSGVTYTAYIKDDGNGILQLIDSSNNELITTVGTIDYSTGFCYIVNLNASILSGASHTDIRLNAEVEEMGRDIAPQVITTTTISTGAVIPQPSQNTVIELDDSIIDTITGSVAGLTVVAVPYQGSN